MKIMCKTSLILKYVPDSCSKTHPYVYLHWRVLAACHSGTEDGAGVLLINSGLDLLTSNKRYTPIFFPPTAQPCTNTASETQHVTSSSTSKLQKLQHRLVYFFCTFNWFISSCCWRCMVQRTEYSFIYILFSLFSQSVRFYSIWILIDKNVYLQFKGKVHSKI